MDGRTVNWAALRTPRGTTSTAEGLRERKKRQTRQQLTDTATEMFVERGFDAVRVAEIAEACGVSEKTVFNYFPTKESLILDHPDTAMAALRVELADPDVPPIEAALRILADELGAMISWLQSQEDQAVVIGKVRRFDELIHTTPSLRAYRRDMLDQVTAVAAGLLADRAGVDAADPEPRIAATALLGLWQVQFDGLSKYLDGIRTLAEVRTAVTDEVHRAARLLEGGLATFATARPKRPRKPSATARRSG
jgi:AcrR family transcriptional regulator